MFEIFCIYTLIAYVVILIIRAIGTAGKGVSNKLDEVSAQQKLHEELKREKENDDVLKLLIASHEKEWGSFAERFEKTNNEETV